MGALERAVSPQVDTAIADTRAVPLPSPHYSREYEELTQRFAGESLNVSFRELVGPLPANEYTHGVFPYPARLLRHIPRFLLATDAVVDGIDLVFDPFVGSGTVLLEAQLRGFESLGVDQNPIASLTSRVKVGHADGTSVLHLLEGVLRNAKRTRRREPVSPLLSGWYAPAALSALARLATTAKEVAPAGSYMSDVAALCVALTARRMANTDARIPVPVRSSRNATATADDVWTTWLGESRALDAKLRSLPADRPVARVLTGDARDAGTWPTAEQARSTLLLTSPPYGAAQKYVRSTSLEAAWLGHAPRGKTVHLEHGSVGREHLSARDLLLKVENIESDNLRRELTAITTKDARRGAIYVAYFADMQRVFANARKRAVKRIALISGTNSVAGGTLHTNEHLADIVQAAGYNRSMSMRDPIRGRTLLTSRRNGTPSPAEYIDVFERSTDD